MIPDHLLSLPLGGNAIARDEEENNSAAVCLLDGNGNIDSTVDHETQTPVIVFFRVCLLVCHKQVPSANHGKRETRKPKTRTGANGQRDE
ncbi:uncharacterized protein SPSK_10488 [Sporothrix schenckii 1099-18]|uniref:Uncharacterized protein n=1 Tax=Sporothrix schenckii 1099-18 TaxID=1397361 RepID=A0A0F2MAQ9_SPOSC|nr:uncharacterized protein SPSK_10488 [Sporothrix schenckii 1099-18]KJR86783.1 hypothetical protein SPSK_10488 [Sporothrix schenckii 1099-18]